MSDQHRQPGRRFHFHTYLQVRFRDVDVKGHVNHAVYFSYFEMARCEYWMSLFSLARLSDIDFIVVHAECNYLQPAQYAEWLDVYVGVTGIRNSSFVMEYEARARRPRRVVATGSTIQVIYDYSSDQTKRMPPSMRRKIERFEKRPLSSAL
jgi:acyl-CoA thioester hydrolase